jgi:biopolymer transport protein TolQ
VITGFVMQIGAAVPSSPMELVTQSSGETKVVLVILAILSLVSWTIMIAKWLEFNRAERAGRDFGERSPASPQKGVMTRAVRFITETTPALAATDNRHARLSASQVEALRQVLDSASGAVRDQLGRFVPSLATIGSVSPLIGLLGTVLGVIEAFIGIATKGSGNIGAVAPGVAEALIATAAALSVAIPAVFGYNIYAHRLNRFDGELDAFGSELIALMVREGRI